MAVKHMALFSGLGGSGKSGGGSGGGGLGSVADMWGDGVVRNKWLGLRATFLSYTLY